MPDLAAIIHLCAGRGGITESIDLFKVRTVNNIRNSYNDFFILKLQ